MSSVDQIWGLAMRVVTPEGDAEQPNIEHPHSIDSNERLSYLTKEAMRAYGRSMQIRLIDHEVSIGHWLFLRALWARDGLTQRELSEHVGLMESTTFSALSALEKLGYVNRVKKPDNRKKVYVHLTQKGKKLEAVLMPLANGLNTTAIHGIEPADVEITKRTLVAIIENLLKDEADLLEQERRVPSTRDLSQLITRRVDRRQRRKKPAQGNLGAP